MVKTFIEHLKKNYNWLAYLIGILSLFVLIYEINNTQNIDYLKILSTIGTLTIAFFAKQGYGKIVANKVNEKQLEVLNNLLIDLTENLIIISFVVFEDYTTEGIKRTNQNKSETRDKNLIKLFNNFQVIHKENIVNYKNKYYLFEFNTDVDYENMFFTPDFLDYLVYIINYEENVLLPRKVSNSLSNLGINKEVIEKIYKSNRNNIEFNPKSNEIIITKENNSKEKKTLYPFVVIGLEKDHLLQPRQGEAFEQESQKNYLDKLIPVSIISKHFMKNYNNTYYNWLNFRNKLNHLGKSLNNWLKNNNVKDVNLPDLDQTNTTSKDT